MCGITGTFNSYKKDYVITALKNIIHRGPDESGCIEFPNSSMGMCRLKIRGETVILPLEVNGNIIAYNGQIYSGQINRNEITPNDIYQEIKILLKSLESGNYVNGMYSLSKYNVNTNTLSLVRDNLGIKPLYWSKVNDSILYGSEIKAFLKQHSFSIDAYSIQSYLLFGSPLGNRTMYKEIKKVEKGTQLDFISENFIIKQDSILNNAFFQLQFKDSLKSLIVKSIQNVSEVNENIGLAVSGGIDSTIIAQVLNNFKKPSIKTFSVFYDSGDIDGVNSLNNLFLKGPITWKKWKHYSVNINPKQYLELLFKCIDVYSEPFALTSAPLYLGLAEKCKKEDIRVLLSGEGVDELFMGYNSYLKLRNTNNLKEFIWNFYVNNEMEKLMNFLFMDPIIKEHKIEFIERYCGDGDLDIFDCIRKIELDLSLEPLLHRTDHCLMHYGIEGRFPFLHNGIPEHALSISGRRHLNIKHGVTKKEIRELFPKNPNSKRRKVPFRIKTNLYFSKIYKRALKDLNGDVNNLLNSIGIHITSIKQLLNKKDKTEMELKIAFRISTLIFWLSRLIVRS